MKWIGELYGIDFVQDDRMVRTDGVTFKPIFMDHTDLEAIQEALMDLQTIMNCRNWKLKKIEVGF